MKDWDEQGLWQEVTRLAYIAGRGSLDPTQWASLSWVEVRKPRGIVSPMCPLYELQSQEAVLQKPIVSLVQMD